MASGRMEFHADSIMQHTNFSFVIPNDFIIEEIKNPRHYDRPTKSLILLHGLTGTDTDWLFGGVAQEMAKQYNLAIFMPTTGNSFYLDRELRHLRRGGAAGLHPGHLRLLPDPGKHHDRGTVHGWLRRDPHGAAVPGDLLCLHCALLGNGDP